MIQHVLKRFSQAAIGLDPPAPKLSLDPFTQLTHHRAAMFLVILEPLLIAHPLRPVVIPVDFPNRLHHLPALDGEYLFEFLELPSTVRQAVGVDRLSHLLPVDRRRVRHLNRRRQRWVSPLQHIIQILASMPAAAEIERDLSAHLVLDYDSARMRRPTLSLSPIFVFPVTRQNPHSRVVDVKELSVRGQLNQLSVDGENGVRHLLAAFKLDRLRKRHAVTLLHPRLSVKRYS